MNNSTCVSHILRIFPVNSDVNLYESYAEFWARIINVIFCSYLIIPNKTDLKYFLQNIQFFMNCERIYSFFQMVKVLNFMGLTYKNLYENHSHSIQLRNTMYKENTNVLSYYIITLILINNYQSFFLWCDINNTSLLQFRKTINNLDSFCSFIEKKYKTRNMLEGISCTTDLLVGLKTKTKRDNQINYILHNLRMTLCEFY
jgi:hypothetical protein